MSNLSRLGTVNPEALGLARAAIEKRAQAEGTDMEKEAFVPGGAPPMDPSMGGGMPPGAPPMDPSMMGGGMPPGAPMDPAMMGGGAPPPPPAGATSPDMLMQQVAAGAQGAGAGAGKGMKVDQNMVMLQMLKLLARIADSVGVKINASDMVITPEDVSQMAEGGVGYAGVTPDGGGAAGGGGAPPPGGGISPIEPMAAAQGPKMAEDQQGSVYEGAFDTEGLQRNIDKASAIVGIRGRTGAA